MEWSNSVYPFKLIGSCGFQRKLHQNEDCSCMFYFENLKLRNAKSIARVWIQLAIVSKIRNQNQTNHKLEYIYIFVFKIGKLGTENYTLDYFRLIS